MPWFMFMMGVSLTFSFNSMVKKGWSKAKMIKKIALRCGKLMAGVEEKIVSHFTVFCRKYLGKETKKMMSGTSSAKESLCVIV